MRRLIFCAVIFVTMAGLAMAQVNVTVAWDASATPSDPANPVLYTLYQCSDSALANCIQKDAADKLSFGPIGLAHQSITWFYVVARNYSVTADGVPTGTVQESPKSNVLAVKAFAPPGNPSKSRITVTQVTGSGSGQILMAILHKRP